MKDTRFKKGNKLGKGRPKLSDLTKAVRYKSMDEIAKIVDAVVLPHEEAKRVMTSNESSLLMKSVFEAIERGDRKLIMDLLLRFLPKPQDNPNAGNSPQVIQLAYSLKD